MGWIHCSVRRKVCMVRIWNRNINLDPQCLPRKVLEWDIHFNGNIWSSNLKSTLSSMDLSRALILEILFVTEQLGLLYMKYIVTNGNNMY